MNFEFYLIPETSFDILQWNMGYIFEPIVLKANKTANKKKYLSIMNFRNSAIDVKENAQNVK